MGKRSGELDWTGIFLAVVIIVAGGWWAISALLSSGSHGHADLSRVYVATASDASTAMPDRAANPSDEIAASDRLAAHEDAAAPAAVASAPAPPPGITLYEFNQIPQGATYKQVCDYLGREGTLMSESHVDGYRRIVKPITDRLYMWYGPDGVSNMNALFQNDRLISKAQLGLR